ncbi:hypothetical protein PN290_01485 [Romboutsia sp. 1001216sp1]|uniref:hypothetical protein n=1 Tax=unclassified Romboutsia TaxID=2626894 RepID=UPI0018AB9DE6|nr:MULTISPECIES: hypothetical protein [unclassified Romboutsia]MDB8794607.1 hypothetical protein [Romboutsia sp. 1001216sp1]MDB8796561.1 hypothetical protein [Romboutsia sp. 1001216sp1]MDB8798039.1 hypothetical protein [Romboutsia sp. 1001216sp1]
MDRAKENYKIGEVRIVSADYIKDTYKRSISFEEKKFFCTNCGEYVTYVYRNKGKTFFRHTNTTEETKQCELRIDSQGQLSVYQRVGLPLYLKKENNNKYQLYIGFYSLGDKTINDLREKQSKITIKPAKNLSSYQKEYYIDKINFFSNTTTLKPINFISSKYNLEYSSKETKALVNEKWGEEIEGINTNGALFKYGENGGRKIRINEEIEADTDYLCIYKYGNMFGYYDGITYEEYGDIVFSNGSYKVYKIRFSLIGKQAKLISEFCRESFKVSLVNKPSYIVSLWPPMVKKNNKVEMFYERYNLLLINSTEKNTRAFRHQKNSYVEMLIENIDKNKYLIKMLPSSIEKAININDEYNSKYLFVSKHNEEIKGFNNEILIKDIDEKVIEQGKYQKLPIDGKLKLYSNSEIELLHYRNDILFRNYKIKSLETVIEDIKFGDRLSIKIGLKNKTILEYEKNKIESNQTFDDFEIYRRLRNLKCYYEPVDAYTKSILKNIKRYPKTYSLLKSYIVTNKIPIGAKGILKKIK